MRKKTALVTAILMLLLLCLGACHGSKGLPEFEMPEGLDETKKYEITFWAKNDTNKTQSEIYYKAIEDFRKIYPNVKVNLRQREIAE